jgi:hypothetical protein
LLTLAVKHPRNPVCFGRAIDITVSVVDTRIASAMYSARSGLKMLHVYRSGQKTRYAPETSGEMVSRWMNVALAGAHLARGFDERNFVLSNSLRTEKPKENASESNHVVSKLGEVSSWIEGLTFCG